MSEKCLTEIKVHLPISLKRDLQDLADFEDRKTSELIRVILEGYLYGAQRKLCRPNSEGTNRDE